MADQVLIVDDDPAICKLLEKVMRSNDMDSQAVGSGEQALQALETRTFDIILLDVNLGDMEGFEVLRRLRERGIKTPVIIISGRNEDYDSLYGLSLGADDYVTKPFRPVVLGAKVKALLRRSREFSSAASQQLRCGPFRYDGATMRFFKGEEVLDLSSREGALLLLFLQHPNQVFTAGQDRTRPPASRPHPHGAGTGLPLCALTAAHHNIEIIPYAGLQSPAFFKKETGTFRFPFFLRKIAD